MPELPEVETVRATLEPRLRGKQIASVFLRYPKMIQGDAAVFAAALANQTLEKIDRIGKYLFFVFTDGIVVSHLRMEGKYFLKPQSDPYEKHEHAIWNFTDGESLRYHDTRKFGTMEWISKDGIENYRQAKNIGLEPLDPQFDALTFYRRLKQTKRVIKAVLLDQSVITGLGNIYVDEVLHRTKIHPSTIANRLTKNDAKNIASQSVVVLNQAIGLGGTTIRSYVSSLGVTGRFQNELTVHQRQGEPCLTCQTPIEKIKVGGRGTYYCPLCQQKKR
jgi:formamidopyrimidine-DNA glycosylase